MEIKLSKEIGDFLLNVENPLLTSYKEKAPGSFKHSEEVANLCDKIGRELKLDLNILKILGWYHDIGKMWYPEFYCENQPKDNNIHDSLNPEVSAHYIISHVANSIAILTTKIDNVPTEIIRCISMHHGNRCLQSIFNKFSDEDKQKQNISKFTYPYSIPDNIYAIVLMIADSTEATLKGLKAAGKVDESNVNTVINKIMTDLIEEKQTDKLTYEQGRIITEVLIGEYNAVNHKRVTTGYNSTDIINRMGDIREGGQL